MRIKIGDIIFWLLLISVNCEVNAQSKLEFGDIYKIEITESGVYKLDAEFFSSIGLNSVNSASVKILGNGGSMLNETNGEFRFSGLNEIPTYFVGGGSVVTNENYLLFYGQGLDVIKYDETSQRLKSEKHLYDTAIHYFVILNSEGDSKKMSTSMHNDSPIYESSEYDYFSKYEVDQYNLLGGFVSQPGSGKRWFGDFFKETRSRNYEDKFDLSDAIAGSNGKFWIEFAGRSGNSSSYNLTINNQKFNQFISRVNVSNVEARYASVGKLNGSFTVNTNNEILFDYPRNNVSSEGWLDFLEIQIRKKLRFESQPLFFSDLQSMSSSFSKFTLASPNSSILIWDITDLHKTKNIHVTQSSSTTSFIYPTPSCVQFVAFDPAQVQRPSYVSEIENQNLLSIKNVNYAIIYHPDFRESAIKLAEHRNSHSGLSVALVPIDQVYNEFSSGNIDPTAIRDFAKYLYDQGKDFKYLLLFGDATYDYRGINKNLASHHFIPPYETSESLDPISSFPSDDFYGLLSDGEGQSLRGALDIGVGRLPVTTPDQAEGIVNKIIKYETNPSSQGDWRVKLGFVADDEDSNIHLSQTDNIAQETNRNFPAYNIEKIYFDAFQQESTPGGERFPSAKRALNNAMFKGLLTLTYLGHGGSSGWAHERVLEIEDINTWNNQDRLPLLVTATCSFASYDDPSIQSGGELALLNPNGGAIALFTTVRAVFSDSNNRLTRSVFRNIFTKVEDRWPTLGEVFMNAKNSNSADTLGINSRKFSLIGDPALTLAYPNYNIKISKINGLEPSPDRMDTIKGLQKVQVEGDIVDNLGNQVLFFDGKVSLTLFDKPVQITTLGQNSNSYPRTFTIQKNVLFKGEAEVSAGKFQLEFIVPKDINYIEGQGKISLYASDGQMDANGFYNRIVIGGTDTGFFADTEGPEINLFMNSDEFKSGGITDENPKLLVLLEDESGINVTGNSIGHDLIAILDSQTQNTIILNDFYVSDLNNFKTGSVTYPLSDLEAGWHSITVKAWDIANNSSEGTINFRVVKGEESIIENIIAFPNPFYERTIFQFEHNINGPDIDIHVKIYSVDGKEVYWETKKIEFFDFISKDFTWSGTTKSGAPLPSGIYFYKIYLTREGQNIAESQLKKVVKVGP